MNAIVLSAGQGRRLLPLTTRDPKCLLEVDGPRTVLELQLRALARCGIRHATVVLGFGADRVERFLSGLRIPGLRVDTLFNPFFATSDNLATCWLARGAMTGDFVLLNGDTLFEDQVLQGLLASPPAPITVTVDHKDGYDDDDMRSRSTRAGACWRSASGSRRERGGESRSGCSASGPLACGPSATSWRE